MSIILVAERRVAMALRASTGSGGGSNEGSLREEGTGGYREAYGNPLG